MTFYVTNQNAVVLSLFLLGVFLGLLYDLVRLKRSFLRPSNFTRFLGDLFYWLIVTVLFLFTIQVTNYGYVRWYEFTAAGCGFFMYRVTLSRYVLTLLRAVVKGIVRMVLFFLRPFFRFATCMKKTVLLSAAHIRHKARLKAIHGYSHKRLRKDISNVKAGVIV